MATMIKKKSPEQAAPPETSKARAQRAIALQHSMESEAFNFMARWQECADYIQPRKGNILTKLSPGSPQTIRLFDVTAEQALLVYAAGLVASLTPLGERWFRLEPKDKDASEEFRAALDEASEDMIKELGSSNFYEVWHEDNLDGGGFGSSLMRTDEYDADDSEGLVGFTNIPVGTFFWRENNRGRISTITRKWKWTAQQAAEEWGVDALTPMVLKAYWSKDVQAAGRTFSFIEVVRPRNKADVIDGPTTPENRPFECLYVCVEDSEIIREDGYYENPYAGGRTMRSNNEPYGRGPGTQAMPVIKGVNSMREDLLTTIERMAKPSWIQPDDTAYEPDNRPDGVTFWDASKGPQYKPEQIQMTNRVDLAKLQIEEERNVIRAFFFNDMFRLLTAENERDREKTAYEVAQMVAEKMVLFTPIFGRITKEKLGPILFRTFSIMYRNGRFAKLQQIAAITGERMEFEIAYVSKIALAIKAIQNQSLATAVQIITALSAIDPSIVNLLKCEEAARAAMSNASVPSSWVRTAAEFAKLAKLQADQAARLQAAQAAEAGTQAIKNLGPTAQSAAGKGLAAAA